MLSLGIELVERGLVPEWIVRAGIRQIVKHREKEIKGLSTERQQERIKSFIDELKSSPVALVPEKANEQHYEVPSQFFKNVLGKRLKYSSALWSDDTNNLDQAEEKMLKCYSERAELKDGQYILELGCGWGSLTLWMAEQYPNSSIIGISNSRSQKEFIDEAAKNRGLKNVSIITADINTWDPGSLIQTTRFDRIVSIEMFEHLRNYKELFRRLSFWLDDNGKLFVHIFCHRFFAYPYEIDGADNWMGKYFFTGGLMPSEELFFHFQDDLTIEHNWRVNGKNYQKTAQAWADKMEENHHDIMKILKVVYGEKEGKRWFERWKIFFLSCAELFGYSEGKEWFVAHYLFSKPRDNGLGQHKPSLSKTNQPESEIH